MLIALFRRPHRSQDTKIDVLGSHDKIVDAQSMSRQDSINHELKIQWTTLNSQEYREWVIFEVSEIKKMWGKPDSRQEEMQSQEECNVKENLVSSAKDEE